MWNLSQMRTRLGQRLAETSTVFWGESEREGYINEAQRFVASITKGVPQEVSGTVDSDTPYLPVSGKPLGEYPSAGVVDGRRVTFVPIEVANAMDPHWGETVGSPRWLIFDPQFSRVYVSPKPYTAMTAEVAVSILPADLVNDSDELFGGAVAMEKYQGVVLNIAAALALLKERYDGDAERFYAFAVNELQSLGFRPAEIPPLREEPNVDA